MNMKKFNLIRLKNAMLFSNLMANVIGVSIVLFLSYRTGFQLSAEIEQLSKRMNPIFLPLSFIVPICLNIIYELPIRRYMNKQYLNKPVDDRETIRVRRRLLNEPFFLIAVVFGMWLTAAVLYAVVFSIAGANQLVVQRSFFLSLYTGLITTTVAFFVFEFLYISWQ